jgi:glutamine cyclotransferase
MVGDYIYANVLPSNVIYKLDKITGEIVKKYDMSELYDI